MATREELLKEYKQLAKRADQRLVRLEASRHDKHFQNILSYAYKKAQKSIERFSGEGAKRFNTKAPESDRELQAKINAIKDFLEKPTSQKSKIKEIYKKRAESINKGYFDKKGEWHEGRGTNFTWEDLANFYESEHASTLAQKIPSSDTLIRALGVIKKVGDDPEKIEKAIESNKKIGENEVVDEIAKRLLSEGYTAEMLFK